MEAYNGKISQKDNDEDLHHWKRLLSDGSSLDEFLKTIVENDSRFLLPPDKDGERYLAIKIKDILDIYNKLRDKNA